MRPPPAPALHAAILGACAVALLAVVLPAAPVRAQAGPAPEPAAGRPFTLEGPGTVTHEENDPRRVAAYRASPADGAAVRWSLAGPDGGAFAIDGGVLRFAIDDGVSRFPVPPDHESPADADEGNDYEVTVEASRGGVTVTRSVTVTVTDVDEAGIVSLSSTQPRLGVALTATLTDPDGVRERAAWRLGALDPPQRLDGHRRRDVEHVHARRRGHGHVPAGDGVLPRRARRGRGGRPDLGGGEGEPAQRPARDDGRRVGEPLARADARVQPGRPPLRRRLRPGGRYDDRHAGGGGLRRAAGGRRRAGRRRERHARDGPRGERRPRHPDRRGRREHDLRRALPDRAPVGGGGDEAPGRHGDPRGPHPAAAATSRPWRCWTTTACPASTGASATRSGRTSASSGVPARTCHPGRTPSTGTRTSRRPRTRWSTWS